MPGIRVGKEDASMQLGSQCEEHWEKAGSTWWKDGSWVMAERALVYLHATWYRTGPIMVRGVTEMIGNDLTGGFVTDRPSGANTLL